MRQDVDFSGQFRGICVDNRDPLGLGRIRVQVPQKMGDRTSGWAFPAYPVGDLGVWPEDRLPKPGQGVWVQFESWDRITWTTVFGEQIESPQHLENLPLSYVPVLELTVPVLPEGVEVTISGTVGSPLGIPGPQAQVALERDLGTGWQEVAVGPLQPDGTWAVPWTRLAGQPADAPFRSRIDPIAPWGSYDGDPPDDPALWDGARNQPTWSEPVQPWDPQLGSEIGWTLDPADVAWQSPVTISGTLASGATGIGLAGREVVLYRRESGAPAWRRTGSAVTDLYGRWSLEWVRETSMTAQMSLRAAFLGDQEYQYDETPEAVLPEITFGVSLTWNRPPITDVGQQVVFSGRAVVSGTTERVPGGTVLLERRTPSNGNWTTVGTATPGGDGSWTINHTISEPIADYRARSPRVWVYLEAVTDPLVTELERETATSPPDLPGTLRTGQPFVVTGTVSVEGGTVNSGFVVLQRYLPAAASPSWEIDPEALPANVENGAFAMLHGSLGVTGEVRWRVVYSGDAAAGLGPSTSASRTRVVELQVPSLRSGGTLTHSSAGLSWSSVSGASAYRVEQSPDGVVWTQIAQVTGTSHNATGLSQNQWYRFRVRAVGADAGGGEVLSGYSSLVRMNTGRPEIRKQGGTQDQINPGPSATWRPADNWVANGSDVVQGFFDTANRVGYGTWTYDSVLWRNGVAQRYGQDVVDNLSINRARVRFVRLGGAGNGGAVNPTVYVTPTFPGQGGRPLLAGGEDFIDGSFPYSGSNQHRDIEFRYPHWARHVLYNEWVNYGNDVVTPTYGFCIYHNSSAAYAKFAGHTYNVGGYQALQLVIDYTWNFVIQSYIAPVWGQSGNLE